MTDKDCRGCARNLEHEKKWDFGPWTYCVECYVLVIDRVLLEGEVAKVYGFYEEKHNENSLL